MLLSIPTASHPYLCQGQFVSSTKLECGSNLCDLTIELLEENWLNRITPDDQNSEAVNSFQWALALLNVNVRFEKDQPKEMDSDL